jgi:integrase
VSDEPRYLTPPACAGPIRNDKPAEGGDVVKLIGRPFWFVERGAGLWAQKVRDEGSGRERKLRVPRAVAPTHSAAHERAASAWILGRYTSEGKVVLTVGELAARMLAMWKVDERVAPKTWEDREGHLRLHLLPVLGSKRPEDLTIPVVRAWVRAQRKTRSSRSAVNNRLSTLALVLDDAAAEGLTKVDGAVARHAAVRRELPEAPVVAPRVLSPEAAEVLLGAETTPLVWALRYALAALAGLEDGAIAGLTFEDVEGAEHGQYDHDPVQGQQGQQRLGHAEQEAQGCGRSIRAGVHRGSEGARAGAARGALVLSVCRAVAQKGPEGWASVSRTKNAHRGSDEAPRLVPVHRALAALLDLWRVEGFRAWTGRDPEPEDFLLPLPDGRPWRPDSARHVRKHLNAAGIAYPEGLTFHDLRGSFLTWLAALGVGEEQRKRLVGHAGGVQAEHYLGRDALLEADRAAIERIPVEVERGDDPKAFRPQAAARTDRRARLVGDDQQPQPSPQVRSEGKRLGEAERAPGGGRPGVPGRLVTVRKTVHTSTACGPAERETTTIVAPPAGIGPATFGLGNRRCGQARPQFQRVFAAEVAGARVSAPANDRGIVADGPQNGPQGCQDEPAVGEAAEALLASFRRAA